MKRAFITGITGQDGSYLSELLLENGYEVYGFVRRTSNNPLIRLQEIKESDRIKIIYGNLRDSASIERALEESRPHEIYNLAAQSDVGVSFKCPEETFEINYYGLGRLVNAAIKICPQAKIYQASTSEMFGKIKSPQTEDSPFEPVSPYGEAKLKAYQDYVVSYRKRHGLFICSGFLFNHESPRRGELFVTRKITSSLAKIKLGLQDSFELGNLDSKRDWGYAGDYVEMMWKMLKQDKPEDYIIATGESHTVRDFVDSAAKALNMPLFWHGEGINEVAKNSQGKVIVKINNKFYRPVEVSDLQGDSSKAEKMLGWKPKIDFNELVKIMVKSDLALVKRENNL